MQSLTDRLADNAPADVAPLDHQYLARRAGMIRTRRRVVGAGLATLVVLVAAVGGLFAARGDDDRTDLASAPVAPNGTPLMEGFGEWTAGTDSPLDSLYNSFDGVLSDGRVLVWGGFREGDEIGYSAAGEQRGAIYDPDADEWTEIPSPPTTLSDPQVQLADDRLLVVGTSQSGTLGGVVFDVREQQWAELPPQSDIRIFADHISWDGTTAVLVRLDEGGRGYAENPGVDWSIEKPVTLTWSPGDNSWTTGAPAPLSLRFGAGTLAHDGHIYVLGGTERNPHANEYPPESETEDPSARADGAVYDTRADRWDPLPDLPQAGIHVHLGTLDDGTILAGGAHATLQPGDAEFGLGPSWTLDGSTWTPYPDHPDPGSAAIVHERIVQTSSLTGHSGPQPEWINVDGAWEQAPLSDLHRWEYLLIATSGTIDNPGDGQFTVMLRGTRNSWISSADAPFTNRMDASVRITGDKLVVIGGFEGSNLTETRAVWVLDLLPDS